ncbi:YcnI family protein [Salinibacterium sp. G-O1]|uniref:YcnI family copper-binding membrane protein n=1 Tax=Salinibacterium sp. G-O1 TaxID=3046208 RepID=UPI0024BB5357|nr:YcnI family protein [Salinibacterium sp. G-O1]MDJ0335514.1 YcnI family protein [Salinibacterium sp. G-O1]
MKRTTMSTIAITAGLALAVAAPLAASAHVSVDPTQSEAGSYSVITFRVPNESETAGTTRVEVSLPTDTPFTSVRYVPVAGWTAELVRSTLPEPVTVGESEITEAVTSVIWTADPGAEIVAGELQLFPLSVGPVPDTGSIVLPTEQTYNDGSVVSWSETGEDAEHPAPVLYINDTAVDHHDAATADDSHEDDELAISAAGDTDSPDVLARVLGIGGLVLGAIALVLAVIARRPAGQ